VSTLILVDTVPFLQIVLSIVAIVLTVVSAGRECVAVANFGKQAGERHTIDLNLVTTNIVGRDGSGGEKFGMVWLIQRIPPLG
jgi:hypothetical protein